MATIIINKWLSIELDATDDASEIVTLRHWLTENGFKYETSNAWNNVHFEIYCKLQSDRDELEEFVENELF